MTSKFRQKQSKNKPKFKKNHYNATLVCMQAYVVWGIVAVLDRSGAGTCCE